MRSTLLPLAAAAVAFVALHAPGAGAAIVPQHSMAGVQVGMSKDEVRTVLGSPTWSRTSEDIFGTRTRWYFADRKVHVLFRRGAERMQVMSVFTRSRRERTTRGVGVGSSEQTVRRKVPGVRCTTFRAPGFADRLCYRGRYEPGQKVTVFDIAGRKRPRVVSVTIGVVID